MARKSFYDSPEYRKQQREVTKRNQDLGLYEHLRKQESRICVRNECTEIFSVQKSSPKLYCSSRCSAIVTNSKRTLSASVRQKISKALTGKASPFKGILQTPRISTICNNPECQKSFLFERHRERKFCSIHCAMKVTGGKPTSPKASRGKAGIRPDIHPSLYFYSRWEANSARLYTFQNILWEFSPTTFDIGNQTYTPDFYLPESDTYIEVKNFWGEYSRIRDTKFRLAHKKVKLTVILKDEYHRLEKEYAHHIPLWEYKNIT